MKITNPGAYIGLILAAGAVWAVVAVIAVDVFRRAVERGRRASLRAEGRAAYWSAR